MRWMLLVAVMLAGCGATAQSRLVDEGAMRFLIVTEGANGSDSAFHREAQRRCPNGYRVVDVSYSGSREMRGFAECAMRWDP